TRPAAPPCGAHERLDLFDHGIAGIDIDSSVGIGEAILISYLSCANSTSVRVRSRFTRRKERNVVESSIFSRLHKRLSGICSNPWRLPRQDRRSSPHGPNRAIGIG